MEFEDKTHLELKGYDAAYKFAKGIFEMYPRVIKSIILFGSYSKGKETESSDVDIMIIMDDVLNNLDNKFLGAFYEDVDKLVKNETSIKLHINFVTLTAFWRGVIAADPVSVNVLRSGVGLIDTGYFEPLQALLQKGEIKPSQESIFAAMARSELYIDSAKLRLAGSVLDIYWSVVNAAQALIMANGEVPPSPEVLLDSLNSLERMNVINLEDVRIFKEIYELGRRLVHNEKIELTGAQIDDLIIKGSKFKEKIDRLINKK